MHAMQEFSSRMPILWRIIREFLDTPQDDDIT